MVRARRVSFLLGIVEFLVTMCLVLGAMALRPSYPWLAALLIVVMAAESLFGRVRRRGYKGASTLLAMGTYILVVSYIVWQFPGPLVGEATWIYFALMLIAVAVNLWDWHKLA